VECADWADEKRQHATAGMNGGIEMASKEQTAVLGKVVFCLTLVAMVFFFWWLLIYDHGVVAAH
jgi:hypothetical protein